jgi:putative oxidoreductase
MLLSKLPSLAGRILIVVIFLMSGINKLMNPAGTIQTIASKHLPAPEVLGYAAIAVEVLAPLLIIIGYRTRLAALALALFVAIITPIFHDYWNVADAAAYMGQYLNFWKNIAILGGLLVLAGLGGGGWSLDARANRS